MVKWMTQADENYVNVLSKDANVQSSQRKGSIVKHIQAFKPLDWQVPVLNDLSEVMLLTGSAGGGKSHVAAEKVHAACLKYPNTEVIVARKIKDDVLKSAYKMLRKKVVGKDERVKFLAESAEYHNGSTIYFVGMRGEREQEAVRSIGTGGIDLVWMEEGHEFEDEDYEEFIGRVRGKNMGWSQIIVTTNPNVPLHWIRRRLIINGEASVYLSSESDNPYNNVYYKQRLRDMKGVKGERLRDGLWVEATGLVIPTFMDDYDNIVDGHTIAGNVTDEAEYNPNGRPVEIWADDGFAGEWDAKAKMFTTRSHPRVFLLVQETPRGAFNVFAEFYAVNRQEAEHLAEVMDRCEAEGWQKPSLGVYDSAAPSLGSYLRSAGVRKAVAGTKKLEDSIRVLRSNMADDESGARAVQIHSRCRMLRLELGSWKLDKKGIPGKFMDNGPDCLRYGIYHHKGPDVGETNVATGDGSDEIDALMDKIDMEYENFVRKVGVSI